MVMGEKCPSNKKEQIDGMQETFRFRETNDENSSPKVNMNTFRGRLAKQFSTHAENVVRVRHDLL